MSLQPSLLHETRKTIPDQAYLSAEGVCKTFWTGSRRGRTSTPVLDDISFDLQRGDFLAIIGPSGCGKSTFLSIVAGLTSYDGTLTIGGEAIKGPGRDRAVVFQDASLLPWRTIERNVMYGLELRREISRAEARDLSRKALSQLGLGGFENHFPDQVSGGMQQRANIARALVVNPDLILMDEPFGALDALTRESLQDQLSELMAELRRTTIFITHDIVEALYLADRVMVMSSRPGRIIADLAVPFGRDRTRAVTETSEFEDLVRETRALLHPGAKDTTA